MAEEVRATRKRARGSYAKFICFRCRERRIKCQLPDDVIPSSDPQSPEKACARCRQHGYDCVVRKTTLGRPNLKKAKILTPSSTATHNSAPGEAGSRSPSPDADDLVLLTLDEEKMSPVAERREVDGESPPNGANMYGAVNRTFDLTSSLLGRDKRYGSAMEALKESKPKPVLELLSEDLTSLLDEHLTWQRLFMPWLPRMAELRRQISASSTNSHCQSAVVLLAMLALIALDVPSERLSSYRDLRTDLHCVVYHIGQKLLFTLPRDEHCLMVLQLVHDNKPLALLDSHQAAAHTLSGNLFGTLITAMQQRLGQDQAARKLRTRLQADDPHDVEGLVMQVLQWCNSIMWRINIDLEEVETIRSEFYEPEIILEEAFEVVGQAIERYSLDKCFFLFHALRYHADDLIATREVTADWQTPSKLSAHIEAHSSLRTQRRKVFDDGLTRLFFKQNRTQEGLALSQLLEIEQGQGFSNVIGLAIFYVVISGSSATGIANKQQAAALGQYYTESINQQLNLVLRQERSDTGDFLEEYGDRHIDALEKRLTDFIHASTDVTLDGIPFVGPPRRTSTNILIVCKEILENNAVRIKIDGALHSRVSMQLILFENAARCLENMEADGGSPDAVARGSVFTACAKLIRSLHRIMRQWKHNYAAGGHPKHACRSCATCGPTCPEPTPEGSSSSADMCMNGVNGYAFNPWPQVDMGLGLQGESGEIFSDWDLWPQLGATEMSSLFPFDIDAVNM